ncbi:MAG TPA: hypothetical protein VKR52_12640 [Terracidiphilus sp.]|nr:hypothetical protein [Terracidiphilus sp.]
MNTAMQSADWSVVREHLPYFAALLFSLPPISFVLIKFALAAKSASKQTKQWQVAPPSQDEIPSVAQARTFSSSQATNQRGVHELLRSIEMMRAEETVASDQPSEALIVENISDVEIESFESSEIVAPIEMAEGMERLEFAAPAETAEAEEAAECFDAFEMFYAPMESIDGADPIEFVESIEEPEAIEPVAVAVMDAKPARLCRSRRPSSRTSRSEEAGHRRAGSRRRR